MNANTLFQNEFVIWGCENGSKTESLLVSTYKGKPITNKRIIEAMIKDLSKIGCTDLRVQEIDFSIGAMDLFVKSLNGSKSAK